MKVDKSVQKSCIVLIKEMAKKNGYKSVQSTVYKVDGSNIIFTDYLIVNSDSLVYRTNIKKSSYDEIFWKVLKMEDNISKGDSLKVVGAFAAPSILISRGKINLSNDINEVALEFWQTLFSDVDNFCRNSTVEEHVTSHEKEMDMKILQCLEYIESKQIGKAIDIAKSQVVLGDRGRFVNEGKGFFELLISRYC